MSLLMPNLLGKGCDMCREMAAKVFFFNLETVPYGVKLLSEKCFINTPPCHTLSQLPCYPWYGMVWGSLRVSELFLMYQAVHLSNPWTSC